MGYFFSIFHPKSDSIRLPVLYIIQPTIISENDLTLEEYLDLLQPGCWYSYKEYVLGKCPGDDIRIPSSLSDCEMTFSPDLAGNVIVTITLQ